MVAAVAYFAAPYADVLLQRWISADVSARTKTIARIVESSIDVSQPETLDLSRIRPILMAVAKDERIEALAVCTQGSTVEVATEFWPNNLACNKQLLAGQTNQTQVVNVDGKAMHLQGVRVSPSDTSLPSQLTLWLLHDLSYGSLRAREGKTYAGLLLVAIWLTVIFLFFAVIQFNFFSWQRTLRRALTLDVSHEERASWLARAGMKNLGLQLDQYSRDLERQSRLLLAQSVVWDRDAIRLLQSQHFADDEIIVVSNRQPYSHSLTSQGITVSAPASGLVTALEPIVQSCGGLWIAHGSGDADRQVVDSEDRIKVPPHEPSYLLHRIWLSEAELQGYYNGFSNQGLWPLCLLSHVRPTFNHQDWDTYQSVNQKFADAIVASATSLNPVVLVQDYHMALVPAMVRKKLPLATIITFWHIPWPNAETFSICPWASQILQGLLGSSIIGFHTAAFCSNFFTCVDRFIEARIDREKSAVYCNGKQSLVKPYPISIDWLEANKHVQNIGSHEAKQGLLTELNLPINSHLVLGVDRMDYSKGLVERLLAFELLLDSQLNLLGQIYLVQIASPTRTQLKDYEKFACHVEAEVRRINAKFLQTKGICPIVLRHWHHSHAEVQRFLKSADICLVTSLHDGMNLVAKEYVAVKDDNSGALVLSQFAGACDELPEATIVNPYDIAGVAQAIAGLLEEPGKKLRERMASMRRTVATKNIYAWAGHMLLDAWGLRQHDRLRSKDAESN